MKRHMTNAPPGSRPVPDDQLWQKIQAFPLDDPHAPLPFSGKLAREQSWSPAFTQKAITEYRKFLLLCCISPHGASPSHIIDQVWHMHLLYTKNYWEDLCAQTLQRSLHHYPSAGGSSERDRHLAWRSDTLQLYRQYFGTAPPPDIWDDNYKTKKTGGLSGITKALRRCFLLLPVLFLSSCGGPGSYSPIIFFTVLFIVTIISQAARSGQTGNDPKKKKDTHCSSSDGCSTSSCGSDSSGCSSGCGGGCGGCGGGGD